MTACIDSRLLNKPRYPYQGESYYNIKENETYIFIDGFWRNSYKFLLQKERLEKLKKINELNS